MKQFVFTALFSLNAFSSDPFIGDITSYNRQTEQKGVRIWAPKDISEIQKVILSARQNKKKLKVKAASHSTSSLILTEGDYLSTKNLEGIISIQDMSVKVKAGTKLGKLSEDLSKLGYSLGFGYPAFRDLTIGGLLATGAHGSSRKHIGVSSQNLMEMTLVDGLGNVHILTPSDGDAFRAAQVHLGLMGVVHDVTLRLYPDFNLQYRYEQIPQFLNSKGEAQFGPEFDSEIVMWSPTTNKAVKYSGSITHLPANPLASNTLLGTTNNVNIAADLARGKGLEAGQASTSVNARLEAARMDEAYNNPFIVKDPANPTHSYVGSSWKMLLSEFFTPAKSFKYMELEFAFPISEADAVLGTVREIALRENISFPISRGLFMRFGPSVGENGPLMSHAERPNTPAEVWVFVSIVDFLANSQTTHGPWSHSRDIFIQELTQKHKLRLHWGKNSDEVFEWFKPTKALGTQLEIFREQVKTFDPEGLFENQFSKDLGI